MSNDNIIYETSGQLNLSLLFVCWPAGADAIILHFCWPARRAQAGAGRADWPLFLDFHPWVASKQAVTTIQQYNTTIYAVCLEVDAGGRSCPVSMTIEEVACAVCGRPPAPALCPALPPVARESSRFSLRRSCLADVLYGEAREDDMKALCVCYSRRWCGKRLSLVRGSL